MVMASGNSNLNNKSLLLQLLEDEEDSSNKLMTLMDNPVNSNVLSNCPALIGSLFLRQSHLKLQGFIEVLEQKNDLEFFKLCRVTRATFCSLVQNIYQYFPENNKKGGRVPIDPKVSLYMTLWYLGRQCTYPEICEQFAVALSTAHFHVNFVIDILNEMSKTTITWPELEEVPNVEANFRKLSNFPGIIGAIDGCHIRIKAPEEYQKDYLDRTMNHSVTLLAVCDSNKKYTFISAGFPGSAHDQRILSHSVLGRALDKNHRDICYSDKYHIIGDSAFTLKTFMMVPFKDTGNLEAKQLLFNHKLSVSRRVIENSFAWLKGRFRRLMYINADLNRISKIITAACVLHNIAIAAAEEIDWLLDDMDTAENEVLIHSQAIQTSTASGIRKRTGIMSSL